MIAFAQLLEEFNARHPELALARCENPDQDGLQLAAKPLPVSIGEGEAHYLHDFIVRHKLRYCLDLCTGLGIAAWVMAQAVRERNGSVLSLDSYMEEHQQREPMGAELQVWPTADGRRVAAHLERDYALEHWMRCRVALVPDYLLYWGAGPYDVVLLDAPKCDDDLVCFLASLTKVLGERFAVFLHDSHTMPRCREICKTYLGVELVNVMPQQKYPFMLATNLDLDAKD